MLIRILTALILIPAALALLWFANPLIWTFAILVISLLALREFFDLAEKAGLGAHRPIGYILTVLFFADFFLLAERKAYALNLESAIALALVICAVGGLLATPDLNKSIRFAACTFFGIAYIPFCLGHALLTRDSHTVAAHGRWMIFFLLACIWVGDSAAYFTGKFFGHHPLAPRISPKKTVEGALGGLVGTVLTGLVFQKLWMPDFPLIHMVILSFLIAVVGQLGDLVESAFKRAANVKDSSSVLPGHGGMLDRIDSLLLVAPLNFYYYLFLIEKHLQHN